ncbi:malectin domain-containing carbohydrate-binding protein [Cohnella silvisoli]|uniref:Malectin domain-containing carbohydrate-binding protein n=1 Tax=Cohnella silvisoli TaxID=2873699 RepID=A0ABV1L285_9BACL|nr:malectin domain-containing carbohydrate-binding protein [Cohnella silvisoli]MCD9025792.1 hypothetical protein [Cohnella silvisoli]
MTKKRFRLSVICLLALLLVIPAFAPSQFLPEAKAASSLGSTIYVFDLDAYENSLDRADWYDMNLFFGTLQGIVNQKGPRLYLRNYHYTPILNDLTGYAHDDTHWETKNINPYWLSKFHQPGQWLSEANITVIPDINTLVNTFLSDIQGLIVWDPKVDATVNVATTLAGIEGAPIVMSGGALYSQLTSSPNNLTVKNTCTASPLTGPCNLTGKFTGVNSKTDAYNWAKVNYLDTGKANPGMLAYIGDGFTRENSGLRTQGYTVERDYLVKNKAFAFDLSPWGDEAPSDAPEASPASKDRDTLLAILQSAYNQYGQYWPIEIVGFVPWWDKYSTFTGAQDSPSGDGRSQHDAIAGEWGSLQVFSGYNAHLTSIIDIVGYGNASFHTWAPVGKDLTNPPQSPPRKTLQNKTYVMYMMGDHDGGTVHQTFPRLWEDDRRGTVPLAWGIVPNMSRDYPDIAQYLYDTATPNDFFIAGASAGGYMNPGYLTSAQLPVWTEWNEQLYKRTGYTMSGFVLNGNAGALSSTVEQQYSKFSADGMGAWMGQIAGPIPDVRSGNMAVTQITTDIFRFDINTAASRLHATAASFGNAGSAPNFIEVRSSWATPRFIEQVNNKIMADYPSDQFEAVDPFTFFSLIRQAKHNQANDAIVLSVDVPDVMVSGQDYDVSVTARNVGSNTWSETTSDRFGAGLSNQFIWKNLNGGYSNNVTDQRVRLSAGESVAPQATKTYKFTVTAPTTSTTNSYTLGTRMVRDGVTWMGTEYTRKVTVVPATGDQAIVTSVTVPSTLAEGATGTVSITVKNVGSTTWTAASNIRLGAVQRVLAHKKIAPNQILWTGSSGWGYSNSETDQRVYLAPGDSIAPGSSKTFAYSIQAPAKRGKYVFSTQMVHDGVAWFGSPVEKEITVVPSGRSGFDAELVGSVVPQYMNANSSAKVTVSIKNTGTETWTAANSYRLGASISGPANQVMFSNFSDGGISNNATDQRVFLKNGESIGPEQTKSFTFNINAGSTTGPRTFSVEMVHEGSGWSGKKYTFTVNVVNGGNDAVFTNHDISLTMAANSIQKVNVEVMNRGSSLWTAGSFYRLGTMSNNQFILKEFRDGGFSNSNADQRVYLNNAETILQNQRKQFTFSLQAPSTPGTYTMEYKMMQDLVGSFGDTLTLTVNVVNGYAQRINSGGGAVTDPNGNWAADCAYGSPSCSTWGYVGTTTTASTANTQAVWNNGTVYSFPATVYQSIRKGSSFGYKFDVSNGTYRVSLAFAEIAKTQTAQRLFAVKAEGQDILSGLDIYKVMWSRTSGGKDKGRTYQFEVPVTDGQLNVDFQGQTDEAAVNGIYVERLY